MKIAEDNYIITEELTTFHRSAAHIQDQSSVFFLPRCKRYHLGKGEEKTFIEYVSTNTYSVCIHSLFFRIPGDAHSEIQRRIRSSLSKQCFHRE